VTRPTLLENMPHRWTTAGYYWENMSSLGNLNLIADRGDFESTVIGVRGGPDHERRRYYERALNVLPNNLEIPDPAFAPAPNPEKKAVVLRTGRGKDGDSSFDYVRRHPTHYDWRDDLEQLTARLVNMNRFYKKIWINTYHLHPPDLPREMTRSHLTNGVEAYSGPRGVFRDEEGVPSWTLRTSSGKCSRP
jgi:hypothetical protein